MRAMAESLARIAAAVRHRIAPTRRSAFSSVRYTSSGPHLEESVQSTVSENPVVIYSKSWCSYSMEVKSLLKRLGVDPLVVELDQLGTKGPQVQNTLENLTGQSTVPNVFIDTLELYQTGELTKLLLELNISKKGVHQP